MFSMPTARNAALGYLFVLGVICSFFLLKTILDPEVTWPRIVGHAAITIVAPTLPLLLYGLGRRIAKTATSERVVSVGVLAAITVPIILFIIALMSAEPLAMLILLYAPVIQAIIGLMTLLTAWRISKSRSND